MSSKSRAREVRLNLKPSEWAIIFRELDQLASREIHARVLLSGQVLSERRLKRGRRYEKAVAKNTNLDSYPQASFGTNNLLKVTIETNDRGTWRLFKDFGNSAGSSSQLHLTNGQPAIPTLPPFDESLFIFGGGVDASHAEAVSFNDIDLDFVFSSQAGPSSSFNELVTYTASPQIPLGGPLEPDSLMPIIQQSPGRAILGLDGSNLGSPFWNSSSLSFPIMSFGYSELLSSLPSKQIKFNLKVRGINLSNRMLGTSSPGELAAGLSSPVNLFFEDVQKCLVTLNEEKRHNRALRYAEIPDAMTLLNAFKKLASNQSDQEYAPNTRSLISPDELLRVNFNQILLSSISNGFCGIESIPLDGIIAYMGRYGDIGPLLTQLLHVNSNRLGSALAENLFRAAIEAKNETVVKRLLATRMIDVDNTACTYAGKKYTPIERAAEQHNFSMVMLLLSAGANVNKTFCLEPRQAGALRHMLSGIPEKTAPSEAVIDLTKILLDAGSNVHPETPGWVSKRLHSPELVYLLTLKVGTDDHPAVFSEKLLALTAKTLNDEKATQIAEESFQACEQTDGCICLKLYRSKIDWALIQAAGLGKSKLVQFLLQKHTPLFPHHILSAAIRSDRDDIIQMVLLLQPDLNGPGHSIEDDEWDPTSYKSWETITTPLSEAIRVGNESIMEMIEKNGGLLDFNRGRRFEAALGAAAEMGDIALVRKLLRSCEQADPQQMYKALLSAMKNDPIRDDIVEMLLEAGADVSLQSNSYPGLPSPPLFVAMAKRNPRLVRAMLNSKPSFEWTNLGPYGHGPQLYDWQGKRSSVIREAVNWGDPLILADIRLTFPRTTIGNDNLCESIKKGDTTILRTLHRYSLIDQAGLQSGLWDAVSMVKAEMVVLLLEFGAVTDSESLFKAVYTHSLEILQILLRHVRHTRYIPKTFGTFALSVAIRLAPGGSEFIDTLLDTKLVDINHSIISDYWYSIDAQIYDDTVNPLGAAIQESKNDQHHEFRTVRKLIQAGCDVNAPAVFSPKIGPIENLTALMLAIRTKNSGLVQFLIEQGANIRTEAKFGYNRTPLQLAAEVGSLEIARLLLELGADIHEAPAWRGGGTAIQMAAISGDCNVAAELLSWGAKLDYPPPSKVQGRWPLEGAAEHCRMDMIQFLWNAAKVQNVVFSPEMCRNAMKLARENGHRACAGLIEDLEKENNEHSLITMAQ